MGEYIKDTVIVSPFPFWLTFLLFILITGFVQYIILYFKEKGKNFATKEDIGNITQKIESVKENYNKSLESHKIELQKEFEYHKYIQTLCHELDKELLSLVSECLNAETSNAIDEYVYDDELVSKTIKLSNFLNTYKSRYKSNKIIRNLIIISSDIKARADVDRLNDYDENGDLHYKLNSEDKKLLIDLSNQTISVFLHTINIDI